MRRVRLPLPVGLANQYDMKLTESTLCGLPAAAEAARDAHWAGGKNQRLCLYVGYDYA